MARGDGEAGRIWRELWRVSKELGISPFHHKAPVHWTEAQVAICTFSSFYDDIRESFERPPDDVIKNDDALDSWLRALTLERERERVQEFMKRGGAAAIARGKMSHVAAGEHGERVFTEQDFLKDENPFDNFVRAGGGTIVYNNPNPEPMMFLTEPTLEEMFTEEELAAMRQR